MIFVRDTKLWFACAILLLCLIAGMIANRYTVNNEQTTNNKQPSTITTSETPKLQGEGSVEPPVVQKIERNEPSKPLLTETAVQPTIAATTATIDKQPTPPPKTFTNPISVQIGAEGVTTTITIENQSTVFVAMVEAREKGGIAFISKSFGGLGEFIEEINGRRSDERARMYWFLYINNKRSPLGVSNLKLSNSDIIMWKYEKEQ